MSRISFLRSTVATSLAAALFATSSMVALAGGKTAMGELTVSGGAEVLVNGEAAQSGRTVFSSNTITTPANTSAVINLGKTGQIEIAPNSSVTLAFDENSISGALASGRVKVNGAENVAANISTKTAQVIADTASAKAFVVNFDGTKTSASSELGSAVLNEAGKTTPVSKDDDDNGGFFSANSAVLYAIIFGGAAATIIYIAARDNNKFTFSTGSTVVSPTR
jgi:hypothetical protein